MEEQKNIEFLLDWHINCGVDVTIADEAFDINAIALESNNISQAISSIRPATTNLAQATIVACQNSRKIADSAESLEELRSLMESFDGCALKLTASNMVFGNGNPNAKIMIIGEAPGADEDRVGKPFVGRSGKLLDKMLTSINLQREEVYITNILPWRPPGNRTPTEAEISICLSFLKKQIELVKPEFILILGGSAANAILYNADPISKLRGKWFEYKTADGRNIDAIASFHPAYLLRNSAQKSKVWADLLRLYKKVA